MSLIIVLAFLLLVMAVVASLFGLAITGTESLKDYRQDRTLRSNVDAALEIGVRNVQLDTTLGEIDSSPCSWDVPVIEGIATDTVFVSGSKLTVSCKPHTSATARSLDGDGGQRYRDVDLTVTCKTAGQANRNAKLECGTSGTNRTVGKARVRYDLDYAVAPASRARVVKVITWDLRRL